MTDPTLRHQPEALATILDRFERGELAIPEFQRDYVWRKARAPKLVDSLYRRFPISSLLIWNGASDVESRSRARRTGRDGKLDWLIDGQQRVTTLSRVRDGDSGIRVVFHPDKEEFRLENAATRNDPSWIRVDRIWEPNEFIQVRRALGFSSNASRTEVRLERVRSILAESVPTVRMEGFPFEDAVDAFSRINTLGVKLRRQDIENARIAAKHSGFIKNDVTPYVDTLRRKGMQRLNVLHLFRACAFIAVPDGRAKTPLHELNRQEVEAAWKKTRAATDRAVDIVRSQFGLVNMDILWSGALFVPVIALCSVFPPKERNEGEIAAWIALAALLHRYSGASDTALDQDLKACRADDPVGALLQNLRRMRDRLAAKPADFDSGLTDRGAQFAAWVACLQRNVTDFFTNGPVVGKSKIDRHHILPRAQFGTRRQAEADRIANIAFIASDVNESIGSTAPDVYLSKVDPATLRSQCVPESRDVWFVDHAADFFHQRQKLLAEAFNEFLGVKLPHRRRVG